MSTNCLKEMVFGALVTLTFNSIAVAQDGYCHQQVQEAAKQVDSISFSKRIVAKATSTFQKYVGLHMKSYDVQLNYDRKYEHELGFGGSVAIYKVKVYEFEREDGYPCHIESVTLASRD